MKLAGKSFMQMSSGFRHTKAGFVPSLVSNVIFLARPISYTIFPGLPNKLGVSRFMLLLAQFGESVALLLLLQSLSGFCC